MALFSDPALRARQDQLNAQWNSLKAAYQACDTPSAAFPEFATDYRLWGEFYESGSDFLDSSKRATDSWQRKAQEWQNRMSAWNCGESGYSDGGLPGVKDPPPDEPDFLDKLADKAQDPFRFLRNVAWAGVALVFVIILGIIWLVSKKSVSGHGVRVS